MKLKKKALTPVGLALQQAGVLTVSATLAGFPVLGYATDLADLPLASTGSTVVKPNILFVLDDSGSMTWEYMPDEMGGETSRVAFRNAACNTVYYNPSTTYARPKDSTGSAFPNASFTSAEPNGFDTSGTNVNLSSSFKAHGGDTAQRAYYYTVSPTPSTNSSACLASPTASSASAHTVTDTEGGVTYTWTKVVLPADATQEQNFANWYAYYRTRMQMMKSSTGLAFQSITSAYRVGFITINPTSGGSVTSSRYLKIADFDAAHKASFYSKLYATTDNGSTPLRQALARAGWIYAGKLNSGLTNGIPTADDPIQYSCQQNFTILTTDGYWNQDNGVDLNNTQIVNEDGNISLTPRPMHDGASSTDYTQTVRTVKEYSLIGSNCSSSATRKKIRVITTITTTNTPVGGGTPVVTVSGPTSATHNNTCTNNHTLPPNTDVTTSSAVTITSGGSNYTLADVAEYYYRTDLRSSTFGTQTNAAGTDISENNVPSSGTGTEDDKASHQHMTTFTLGLGLFGTIAFSSDYKSNTNPSTPFNQIRAGTLNWPSVPNATTSEPQKADDLWHAAVNGRGQAFTASNPQDVINGLTTALAGVNARVASAAAAATSNLEPVAGDNFAYTASYETQNWVGDVQAREIDLASGTVSSTPNWSASTKLDLRTGDACDTRTIKLFRSGATDNLVNFTASTDTCTSGTQTASGVLSTELDGTELGWYAEANLTTLAQFDTGATGMTAAQKTASAGASMVNFIRGQRGKEGFIAGDVNALYRERTHVLGDIVNAQPVYVKSAVANYTENNYNTFKTVTVASRTPMVYVAANDGMLHAFKAGTSSSDATGGDESWTYIPRLVAPELWRLADTNWKTTHKFNVDGTPVVSDIWDGSAWRTILVAGLNKGGKGFYALDITNPTSPKALWEFGYSSTCFDASNTATHGADCHMGYSYGNPVIGKLSNGTWAVFVTSGYNNNNGAASDDGEGFLYVLNALTGQIIKKIGTNVGTNAAPSGLGKINAWTNNGFIDNTIERVYGVDLLGNLWRFDTNGAAASGSLATRIATFADGGGTPQPITTKPVLTEVNSEPFVYVATGQYLGSTDIGSTGVQSLYAIRDPLTAVAYTNPRTQLKKNTITNTTVGGVLIRQAACTTNCSSTDGWFIDWPDTGERVNVDMKLQLGTLTVVSNVPQNNACNIGGYSYINFFNYSDGLAVATSTNASVGSKLSDSLAVGINIVRLPSGKTVAIATTSDASQKTVDVPTAGEALSGRRVSWRELGE